MAYVMPVFDVRMSGGQWTGPLFQFEGQAGAISAARGIVDFRFPIADWQREPQITQIGQILNCGEPSPL